MKHLKVGDTVPKFRVKDQNGNLFSPTQLKTGKWALYFYPKDLTPGCINQACNLKDNFNTLLQKGIRVAGVSMDTEKLHQRFIDKYELPFPLLADTDRKVIDAFGVWGEKKFMGRVYDGIHRTTFLIQKGIIIGIIERPKTKYHAEEILEVFNRHKDLKTQGVAIKKHNVNSLRTSANNFVTSNSSKIT
ncbi:MAG: Peroxiredoxin [Crocinitomicaceae bacterium]|jgi:peroxiredoxin Q/BCP|nr:Peroxiredoxin [Crocinitomicaceae bacterium]